MRLPLSSGPSVTPEPEAFDVLGKRYRRELRGVNVVSLLEGRTLSG
jgi:hypothetical protein